MSLASGTPAPLFFAPSPGQASAEFASAGGRYVLLAFLPEPSPERDAAVAAITGAQGLFRDDNAVAFGVLPDAPSLAAAVNQPNVMRWFGDAGGELRTLYQVSAPEWFLIDPALRVIACGPLAGIGEGLRRLAALGSADDHAGVPLTAPVLIVPRVLEPEFCRELIAVYTADGGTPSGVMQTVDGKLVGMVDARKRRRDAEIPPGPLQSGLRSRIASRLLPEIKKAFQFQATRIERFIVACYDSADGGYFRMHKDDGAPGTAHRKFAVSINLNSEDFEGGDLRFPEFGRKTYRPPTGGAVVFSCSLLHEATPVTRGVRYATLPFLYDEAGAQLREANARAAAAAEA
jgi:predicted 2-oxoglutarate/Fe(II)-dependent dioxygenase YbiX